MIDEALEHLVKGIVDNPEDVLISEKNHRRGLTLEVRVNPDDIGKRSEEHTSELQSH